MMTVTPFDDPGVALRTTTILLCLGVMLSSAQVVAASDEFSNRGLLAWRIVRHRRSIRWTPWRLFDRSEPGARSVVIFAIVRGVAAAMASVAAVRGVHGIVALGAMVLASMALATRGALPTGADRLAHVTAVALFVAASVGSIGAVRAAMLFVAAVSCLVYVSAGVGKQKSAGWRSRDLPAQILATGLWSSPLLAQSARRHPSLAKWLSSAVVAFELAFPVVLLVPSPAAWAMLAGGLVFHTALAASLGLNVFWWMFVATYPAILYANHVVGWYTGLQ